jgi:hypothetical protein
VFFGLIYPNGIVLQAIAILQFARARECFDKVLGKAPTIDPFYRRALSEIALQASRPPQPISSRSSRAIRSTTINGP